MEKSPKKPIKKSTKIIKLGTLPKISLKPIFDILDKYPPKKYDRPFDFLVEYYKNKIQNQKQTLSKP